MNGQQEYDRMLRMMIKADPGLQELARAGRRLARNHRWVSGGTRAAVVVTACAVAAWFLVPFIVTAWGLVLAVEAWKTLRGRLKK